MRRALIVVGVAAALVGAPSARASTGVEHQAWTSTATVASFTPRPGHVYVASGAAGEEARSFVAFSSDVAFSDDAQLLLISDDDLGLIPPTLAACPLAQPLRASGHLTADEAPAAVCTNPIPIEAVGDRQWRVPLRSLDPGTAGIAVIPSPGSAGIWRVGFDASRTQLDGATATTAPPAAVPTTVAEAIPSGEFPALAIEAPPTVVPQVPHLPDVAAPPAEASEQTAPLFRRAAESIDHPGTILTMALALASVVLGGIGVRRRERRPHGGAALGRRLPLPALLTGAAFVVIPPLVLTEADVFRFGSVVIVAIAAVGLHMLVNWTGELSLATAAGVGLPAFAVAKLAADWGVTPLALLPVGVAVGAVAGVVIGLPSLRARGLQVALVTLAAGIAVERFLFTKPWLVGPPGGVAVPVPTLGPLRFETSAALYPVLALVAVAAVAGAAVLHHSKAARAMAWIRDQPEAAAAFAIPVTSYRLAAYGLTGAYAGLAGGLSATWVQRLTPGAFPFTLSFTYLVMVVLAGRGFVWGVVAAVALLEGGRVFASGVGPVVAYGGPIALVFVITRHRAGLNGTGRKLMETARRILTTEDTARPRATLTTIAGVGAVVLGLTSIALAWYHAGNTDQVWVQNQLLLSGGLVGLAFVILGGLAVATERIIRALERRE